jgi:phage regulator Rha-like protein
MSNELMVFEGNNVEILVLGEQVLFNARDIGKALDIGNVRDNIRSFSKNHVVKLTNSKVGITDFRKLHNTGENFLTEAGVYKLAFSSRKEKAQEFTDWVTCKVLPSIRKTYEVLKTIEFKGNIDGIVWSKNGKPITTSRVISDYTGKEHKHILRDIRDEIEELKKIGPNLDRSSDDIDLIINDFNQNSYLDTYGREQVEYELGELATMQLLLKYSTEYRAKFIIMFYKMKEALNNMFKARLIESVLPQDKRLRQYIYVIKNPLNETVKIGVAQNVNDRIKQLQTGAGVELELLYQSLICSNAFSIETEVHSKFEKYRTFGEWFKVSPNIVIEFLESQTFVLKSEFTKNLDLFRKGDGRYE